MTNEVAERWMIAVLSLFAAFLCYLATCSANAEPYTVRYQNTDPLRSVSALRICQGATCVEAPSVCGPGATCTATLELALGTFTTTALVATTASGPWSLPSNALQIAVLNADQRCLASDFCRADFDRSGTVTATDFSRFLRAFSGL